jgi:hypothetical protein
MDELETAKKLTSATVNTNISIVLSFYSYKNLHIGKISIPQRTVTYHNRDIEKDEIAQISAIQHLREKAFNYVMAESRLRPIFLCKLLARARQGKSKNPLNLADNKQIWFIFFYY